MKHLLLITLTFLLQPLSAQAEIKDLPSLTILTPVSMTDVMATIARQYSRDHDVTVSVQFGSSTDLSDAVREGAPADVFISGNVASINLLKLQGMVDVYSVTNLFRNRLVLITSQNMARDNNIENLADAWDYIRASDSSPVIYLPDSTQSIAGSLSISLMKESGTWPQDMSKIGYVDNTRLAAETAIKNNAFAITYQSEVERYPEAVVLDIFRDSNNATITYQGAVVAGENMALAREFLQYVKQKKAAAIIGRYGFLGL